MMNSSIRTQSTLARSSRTGWRTPIAAIAAALTMWIASPGNVQAEAQTPEQVISNVAENMLTILRDAETDSAKKRALVEDLVMGQTDLVVISKLVLARNWTKFEGAQRDKFLAAFRTYLSITYGKNIDNYSNETVEVTGGREEARGDYTVRTKIVRSSADDILVDYRLRKADDRWLIIDFVAEGVSMIGNLRSQFQEIISKKGPEGLIKTLNEKNAESDQPTQNATASSGEN